MGGGSGGLGVVCGLVAGGFQGGKGFVGWLGTLEGCLAGAGGFDGTGGLPGFRTGVGNVGRTIGLGGLDGTPGAPGFFPGKFGFFLGSGLGSGITGLGTGIGVDGLAGAVIVIG